MSDCGFDTSPGEQRQRHGKQECGRQPGWSGPPHGSGRIAWRWALSALLNRVGAVGALTKEPQRRDERRERSGKEGAQANHLSVTDLQVTETGLSLHCNSRNCSQAATNFPSPWKRVGCILFGCGFAALCPSHLCGQIPDASDAGTASRLGLGIQ